MNETLLFLTLWAASGAALGGVATSLIAADKGLNEWLAALGGLLIGAVGNVVLLVPAWVLLARLPDATHDRPAWHRDTVRPSELAATPARPAVSLLDQLKQDFWPKARAHHAHSHRMTYVGVFAALTMITAIEVILSVVSMPFNVVGPLVALSTTKVLLVAMYFMHLRFDSKWYTAVFAAGVPFAVVVLTVMALS